MKKAKPEEKQKSSLHMLKIVATVFVLVTFTTAIAQQQGIFQLLQKRSSVEVKDEHIQPTQIDPTMVIITATPSEQQNADVESITSTPTITPSQAKPKPTPTKTPIPTTIKPTPTPTKTPVPTKTPTPTPTPTIDYSKPWTVAPNCPSTTLACVPCTSGSDCRFEPGKTHGFRGWACQNNNPGNIRNSSTNLSTDFKNQMIVRNGGTAACGIRYDSRGGSYFVFATYSIGYGALKAYIKGISNGEHSAYTGCGNCSIAFFFSKYAPNDSTYASTVAAEIGEPVTQTLNYVVANKLTQFADAIKHHEGFITQ